MKKLFYLSMAVLLVLGAVSCDKDSKTASYGEDEVTHMPEAIDLGIVVGGHKVLWGNCNIGASKEYELGDHFAWGEITPKKNYTWATYSHANGAYNKLIKYCPWSEEDGYWDFAAKPSGADDYMQLKPQDDVASVRLGGKWRMPTKEDFFALLALQESGDYKWEPWFEMKDANGKAVHGLKVTQKSTNNYVFFPAAGQYREDRLYSGEDPDVESGFPFPSKSI